MRCSWVCRRSVRRPVRGRRVIGGKGYKFKGSSPDGLSHALLKDGEAGKSKALVKGKGAALPDVPLPLTYPVTVQLRKTAPVLPGEHLHQRRREEERRDAVQGEAVAPHRSASHLRSCGGITIHSRRPPTNEERDAHDHIEEPESQSELRFRRGGFWLRRSPFWLALTVRHSLPNRVTQRHSATGPLKLGICLDGQRLAQRAPRRPRLGRRPPMEHMVH